jgi:hypothetical protein
MTADIEVLKQQSAAFNRYAGLLETNLKKENGERPGIVADLKNLAWQTGEIILNTKLEDFPLLDQGQARGILNNVAQRFVRLRNISPGRKG